MITEDSDLVAYGVRRVLFKMDTCVLLRVAGRQWRRRRGDVACRCKAVTVGTLPFALAPPLLQVWLLLGAVP